MTMRRTGLSEPELPEISVVVPLFNEEQNIGELYQRLTESLGAAGVRYELVLVNDGSRDTTPQMLDELEAVDDRVVPVHFSRNFGHQPAVCAGIDRARGQAVIVMDGDLQDPPEVLEQLIETWRAGSDVVYAIRSKRKESLLKRAGYALFYRLLRRISDLEIPLDSGDFCLMDRRVVDVLTHLPERQRFVRGLRCFVGFRQTGLRYERAARNAGEPKYTFRALLRLALDGLINFSGFPLNLIGYLGVTMLVVTLLVSAGMAIACLAGGSSLSGWSAVLVSVLVSSTVQLLSLGIMSEYIRRIFIESKGRPTYIVDDRMPVESRGRQVLPMSRKENAGTSRSAA
jgi:polyisoprenyl-phosphate glycosyltransferase